jgi:hypothetical protein
MNPDSNSNDHNASSARKGVDRQLDLGATSPPKTEDAVLRFRRLLAEVIARRLVAEQRPMPESKDAGQG